MKAEEVQSYAAGERNFAGANLRGCSFKGQDLRGANFSGADIRGANFTNANLSGANFTGAKAGLQKRWMIAQLIAVILLLIILSFISVLLHASLFSLLLTPESIQQYTIFPGSAVLCVNIIVFVTIARQGFTTKAMGTILVAIAVAFVVAFTTRIPVAIAYVFVFAVGLIFVFVLVFAIAPAFVFAVALLLAVALLFANTSIITFVFAVIPLAVSLLSLHVTWRVNKGDEKFTIVRTIGVAIRSIGGTTFYKADLTDANFSSATLKSTNFNEATLTRTCWTNAKKLDRARVGNSILSIAKVRDLLVTGNGYSKNYEGCNLRGANLTGATLHKANLKRADLGEAILHKADLREANLTEVQALETNFTEAYFTGACLEGWNIDHTTKLDRVDCQYVFLLEHPNALGNRERRPHHPDQVFAKGDFEKLYKKMINVVQVLLRDGINQEAFRAAFLKLMEEHPDISFDSIQGIEKKGNDVLLTIEVDETTDKAKFSQNLLKHYEDENKQLKAENKQLHLLRAADMKEIAIAQANKPTHITQVAGDNAMNDQQNFNVGGDFNINANNSIVGLQAISGNVTNAINQLSDAPAGETNLKELLIQLQAVLETADATVLPEADKADALEEVKLLAEAAQKPEAEKKTIASKAVRSLQRIVGAIPTAVPMATTLITEFNKLVPAIVTLLGL